jgi:single-stranded-DNA-specific exonuclease
MPLKWSYSEYKNGSILDQIKQNRNFSDSFINASPQDLPDISLFKDIKLASGRIIEAVQRKEKIMIFGHDDVDGVTSAYILFDFLEKIGSQNHFYYIPNRLIESHGMKDNFVNKLIEEKFDLIITVDGGISEFEQTKKIMDAGIDVIITDHHLVQEKVPEAFAVVNPKQADCDYPFKMLAGVAVTYFLVQQVALDLNCEIDHNYLFWTAVGTLADKVPLLGANRIIIKDVLGKWFIFDDTAIDTMKPYFVAPLNFEKRMSILKYITKILSNGRLPKGENLALSYMLVSRKEKEVIINKLIAEQRDHEYKLKKLSSYLKSTITRPALNWLFLTDSDNEIEINLMGYSASFLTKKFMIPVVILKERGSVFSGECRCMEGFNLIEAFTYCREHLIQFGGHKKAAGFTILPSEIENFQKKFSVFVDKRKHEIEFSRKISVDAVFSIDELDKLDDYLQTDYYLLQPFGQGNSNPKFLLKNYHPERDANKIKLKKAENKLESGKIYNLIVSHKGSSLNLVDHRNINYML